MPSARSPIVLLGPALKNDTKIREAAGPSGCQILDVAGINASLLGALGLSPSHVDPLPEDWMSLPMVQSGLQALRTIIRSANGKGENWGIVDPGVNLLLPIYMEAFAQEQIQPTFAVCAVRPTPAIRLHLPDDDVDSSGMREAGVWLHSTLSSLRITSGMDRIVIPHEIPPQSLWEAVIGEQNTANADKEDLKNLAGLPPLVVKTYECCIRASQDPQAFQSGALDSEIEALWEELRGLSQMIRPSLLPEAPMMFFWREGNETKQQEQMFTPSGTWQALSVELAAPSGTIIQVAPYHMPCRIWIRKAAWKVSGGVTQAELLPGPTGRVENIEGLTRLSVFGPAAFLVQGPHQSPAKLELEFYIQATETVLTDIIEMLAAYVNRKS